MLGVQFGHCSAGPRASEGLNKPAAPSPEHLAGPLVVVIRRKRLFLVSAYEILPPQGDLNVLQLSKRLFLSGNKGGFTGDLVSQGMILAACIDPCLRFIHW